MNVRDDETTGITDETELEDTKTEIVSNYESQTETSESEGTENPSETKSETSYNTEAPTTTETEPETETQSETRTEAEFNTETDTESEFESESDNNFVVENDEYNIKLTLSGSTLPQNTVLSVNKISSGNQLTEIQNALSDSASKFYAYDMNLSVYGSVIQPNGTVTIKMPLPADISQTKAAVYYISSDYSVNEIASRVDGGYISFETTHFSVYAIGEKKTIPTISTVIFDANGGSGSMSAQTVEIGVQSNLKSCSFTKEGFVFSGWSTSADGAIVYIDGDYFTADTETEITLYAIWEKAPVNKVLVYFRPNGGDGTEIKIEVDVNSNFEFPECEFICEGYSFDYWSVNESGTSDLYMAKSQYNVGDTVTELNFYANWLPNDNTLNLDGNGGSCEGGGTLYRISTLVGTNTTLCANPFSRDGYTFIGWSTTANGAVEYEDQSEYTMGTNSEYTLYAIWIACDYTITYVLNGGSNNLSMLILIIQKTTKDIKDFML